MGGAQNPRLIGFAQALDPAYWDWASDPTLAPLLTDISELLEQVNSAYENWIDDPAVSPLMQDAIRKLGEFLNERLEFGAGCSVGHFNLVVHDKDTHYISEWGAHDPKLLHIHGLVEFNGGRKGSASMSALSAALGLEQQYIEKPKSGRYSSDNMRAYLIHAKDCEKYQYDPREVVTICGQDYLKIEAQQRQIWKQGAAIKHTKSLKEKVELVRERILAGSITRQQVNLSDELYEVYARNMRVLDDAFRAYGDRRAYKAAAKLEAGEFNIVPIFIWGRSGSGKTWLANNIIRDLRARYGWDVYRGASSNSLDDYAGEEIIFLDDLRAQAMDASDWLLLLDRYNASPASARYHNKPNVAPRVIIITAPIPPIEYFYYVRNKGNVTEALDQFIRRLAAIIEVRDADYEWSLVGGLSASQVAHITTNTGEQRRVEMNYGATTSYELDCDSVMQSTRLLLESVATEPLKEITNC